MAQLSHSQAAEREAMEEAGAVGDIERNHFHLYLHSKGLFWKPPGVQEFVVKAYLLQVREMQAGYEENRNPTWFSTEEAKRILMKRREIKYGRELQIVIDRACERLLAESFPLRTGASRAQQNYTNL